MRRSILCIIIIASLIFCSTSIAFANPLDPWSASQAHTVTQGVMSIDSTLSNVYTGLTALYNYLKNNGDGVVEGLLVLANRVSNIISTIDYYLPYINTNLQNIYSSLAAHSGSNLDLWGLTNNILTNTNALATGQLGIAQDIYNINSTTADIDRLAGLIHSDVDQVESQLTSINANLQSLNNIEWIDTNAINVQFSLDNITYYPFSDYVSRSTDSIYLKFSADNSLNSYNLFRIKIPLYANYTYVNFDIYGIDSNYDINYYFDRHSTFQYLYIYPLSFRSGFDTFTIRLYTNMSTFYKGNDFTYSYIPNTSNDFYTLVNYIRSLQNNDSSNLSDIKNILIDIDNNSDFIQNNNDLHINVDIDASDGQGVTAVISKIQDLLDFGISLQEFLVVLNQFDNLHWFTRLETYEQVNQDPRFSPGYIDLYD